MLLAKAYIVAYVILIALGVWMMVLLVRFIVWSAGLLKGLIPRQVPGNAEAPNAVRAREEISLKPKPRLRRNWLSGIGIIYAMTLACSFVWQQPWREKNHWKNLESLESKEPIVLDRSWVTERMRSRLANKD